MTYFKQLNYVTSLPNKQLGIPASHGFVRITKNNMGTLDIQLDTVDITGCFMYDGHIIYRYDEDQCVYVPTLDSRNYVRRWIDEYVSKNHNVMAQT